jgi:hypothetical protein
LKKEKELYIPRLFSNCYGFFLSGFGTNALFITKMEGGSAKNQNFFKLFISFIVCATTTGAGLPAPVGRVKNIWCPSADGRFFNGSANRSVALAYSLFGYLI